jgi:hypothetical protein
MHGLFSLSKDKCKGRLGISLRPFCHVINEYNMEPKTELDLNVSLNLPQNQAKPAKAAMLLFV